MGVDSLDQLKKNLNFLTQSEKQIELNVQIKNIEPKSWISVDNNLPSDSVGFFVKLFKNAIYENTFAKNNNAMFLENLTNNTIIPILLNAPNNIFVNKLPPKATIINKKPYYINKKILIKN